MDNFQKAVEQMNLLRIAQKNFEKFPSKASATQLKNTETSFDTYLKEAAAIVISEMQTKPLEPHVFWEAWAI